MKEFEGLKIPDELEKVLEDGSDDICLKVWQLRDNCKGCAECICNPKNNEQLDRYIEQTKKDVNMNNEKTLPREMYVWDYEVRPANPLYETVVYIHKDGSCVALNGFNTLELWKHCEDIPEQKTRPMTDAEIFKALREGAVVKVDGDSIVVNYWNNGWNKHNHIICYNFTGTDADIWQKLEVTE